MLNFLQGIPEPYFLVAFGLLCAGLTALAWFWVRRDETLGVPRLEPAWQTTWRLAYLRDRASGVLRCVLFRLFHERLVDLQSADAALTLRATGQPHRRPLDVVESRLLAVLREPCPVDTLLASRPLRAELEQALQPDLELLLQARLLRTTDEKLMAWLKTAGLLSVLLLAGGLRQYVCFAHEGWSLFLTLEMVAGAFAPVLLARPWSHLTALGWRHLDYVREQFCWVEEDLAQGRLPEGLDPAWMLAALGTDAVVLGRPSEFCAALTPLQAPSKGEPAQGRWTIAD